ncbi:unnamed protein product, partial [Closterium sp. NIES-53]
LVLHWMKPSSTVLTLVLETSKPGWAAMGWSVDGRMAGSDAVVGNSDTPGLYTLTSTAPGDQHLMITTSLVGGMETTPNLKYPDGKFIKFSRTEGTGHVPVKLSGPSAIIYAFSADGSTAFSYHGPN